MSCLVDSNSFRGVKPCVKRKGWFVVFLYTHGEFAGEKSLPANRLFMPVGYVFS